MSILRASAHELTAARGELARRMPQLHERKISRLRFVTIEQPPAVGEIPTGTSAGV